MEKLFFRLDLVAGASDQRGREMQVLQNKHSDN